MIKKTIITPNFDAINPQLCVNAKLRKLHRILNNVYQKKINPYGLRGSMLSILFIIGKREGINQKAIAEMLVLDQSTMSRDLKRLKENGWVTSTKGEDLRNSKLFISKKGYQLLEEVSPIWQELHTNVENILGQFNIQQLDVITEALKTNLLEKNQ